MTSTEAAGLGGVAARFVGASVPRREDARLLTGRGCFVDDVSTPDLLHVAFLRSDMARGTIRAIDTSAAIALDGVRAVFLDADLSVPPGGFASSLFPPTAPRSPQRGLASTDVRFVGEPVAMVVADSRYVAEDACELIDVDIEPSNPVVRYDRAVDAAAVVHPEIGTNVAATAASPPDPEVDRAMREAPHVVTVTIGQHRQTNSPMETRGIVATWTPYEETLLVHVASQSPHEVRDVMARALSIDEGHVRVVQQDVGGGFGQKMLMGREEILVAVAARRLRASLKWIEDRRENLMASTSARIGHVTVTFALDEDLHFVAAAVDHVEDLGACPMGIAGATAVQVCRIFPGPYRIPRYSWRSTSVWTNTIGRGAYRGPWMLETVAREQAVDHVARTLGIDPLELRRRNVLDSGELPYTTQGNYTYDVVTPGRCLDQAVEIIDYEGFRREQAGAHRRGEALGVGLGLFIEPTSRGTGKLGTEAATVRVTSSGAVDVYLGTGSHGQGIETTIAQVVADELGAPLEAVTVHQGDTHSSPFGAGTGGSRTAVLVGGAARSSSKVVRDKLTTLAAHLLEAAPADITLDAGRAFVRGVPSRGLTFAELGRAAYIEIDRLPPGAGPGLEATERYRAPEVTWSNGCHACTVTVDLETGQVRILRYVVSEDCGVVINPMIVEGQISGGVVQGMGGVLFEHLAYDDAGNPLATTFLDYLLPGAAEVPVIEFGHVETPANTPGGHKGMGEGGAIGSVPCIANAVADALAPLGVSVVSQPLGPSEIVTLLEAAGQ